MINQCSILDHRGATEHGVPWVQDSPSETSGRNAAPLAGLNRHTCEGVPSMAQSDPFGARSSLRSAQGDPAYYSLSSLNRRGVNGVDRLPITVKIFLENALR